MAITVTSFRNNLGSKIVKDTQATNVLAVNTTDAAGSLYTVQVVNPNTYPVHFKMANVLTGTVGTVAADVVLLCSGSATLDFVFPSAIVFDTGFSHWCVKGAAQSSSLVPASAVTASYVTS
jgi:hypothetical protein